MSDRSVIDNVIENILYMPSKFHSLGDISMLELFRESGYIQAHTFITTENIKSALVNHQECVRDWIISSGDKRVSSGWFILDQDNGKYIVGYFSRTERFELPEFDNVEDACAEYIKRELESFRNL
jgi:hypothetical protein